MRYNLSLRLLSMTISVACAACIGADYPDEFDDSANLAQTGDGGAADAGASFTAPIAQADAGAGGSIAGGSIGNPSPLGGGNPTLVDAGPQANGGTDSGTTTPWPVADAGTHVDAGGGGVVHVDASTTQPEDSGPASTGGTATSCKITANTDASDTFFYAGKYGCAVWISDSSKKVVKAFMVATRIASRSGLPTYQSQSAGVSVDVTTSATLGSAKQHNYTWDLSGVAPGSYSLNVEVHSSNGVTLVSVPFDTSAAPVSESGSNGEVKSADISCD